MSLFIDVKNYFVTNWIPANTNNVTPNFYLARDLKQYIHIENRLVFYARSGEPESPAGLGYNEIDISPDFGIDIYTNVSQDLVDLFEVEAKRLLRLLRKSSLNMDFIKVTNSIPASAPGYSSYHYVIEAIGKKHGKAI